MLCCRLAKRRAAIARQKKKVDAGGEVAGASPLVPHCAAQPLGDPSVSSHFFSILSTLFPDFPGRISAELFRQACGGSPAEPPVPASPVEPLVEHPVRANPVEPLVCASPVPEAPVQVSPPHPLAHVPAEGEFDDEEWQRADARSPPQRFLMFSIGYVLSHVCLRFSTCVTL